MNIKKSTFDPRLLDQTLSRVEKLESLSSVELPTQVDEISSELQNLLLSMEEYNQSLQGAPTIDAGRATFDPTHVSKSKQRLAAVMNGFPNYINNKEADRATRERMADLLARLLPALSKELDNLNKNLKNHRIGLKVQEIDEGPKSF